jgi:hypothetical protein
LNKHLLFRRDIYIKEPFTTGVIEMGPPPRWSPSLATPPAKISAFTSDGRGRLDLQPRLDATTGAMAAI